MVSMKMEIKKEVMIEHTVRSRCMLYLSEHTHREREREIKKRKERERERMSPGRTNERDAAFSRPLSSECIYI